MRVIIVRNTPDAEVLTRRGRQNKEFYRESDIESVRQALVQGGHEVSVLEGDILLVARLREEFPATGQGGEGDPVIFNLAYGVQGDCRYTQVPALLELAGLRYVGSGPRAHTLCLDKYITKVVLQRAGLPTPAFSLLRAPGAPLGGDLDYPVIVKPQSESTSFGVRVVHDRQELDQAAGTIFEEFQQPVLVEQFIPGKEVNCGVLGNGPGEALPVMMIDFGKGDDSADAIFSYEVKMARTTTHVCPAPIPDELTSRVQELAVDAFNVLGCADCARVDFRVDAAGNPFILEINSMVVIHPFGSYFHAAETLGLSYKDLINGVLQRALDRYG